MDTWPCLHPIRFPHISAMSWNSSGTRLYVAQTPSEESVASVICVEARRFAQMQSSNHVNKTYMAKFADQASARLYRIHVEPRLSGPWLFSQATGGPSDRPFRTGCDACCPLLSAVCSTPLTLEYNQLAAIAAVHRQAPCQGLVLGPKAYNGLTLGRYMDQPSW